MRNHVRERKRQMGLDRRETFVPQSYSWAQEAQVDWYEAWVDLGDERTKVQVFAMRSMASGAAFHRAYLHATQQAFLEAHEHAFAYFGGVFHLLRYDNLASAVRKILRGHRREETVRFMAFRSHWRFAAEFCTPGEGHEKGGVEGEGGYFRRNHLVPVPRVADLDALNALLLSGCRADEARVLDGRTQSVGAALARSAAICCRCAAEGFDLAEIVFPLVDKQGCITVKTNFYSVPVRAWHPGGSACASAARRGLARRPPDCPPRALPQPPPACARSRALPRRAEPQARRVRRVQAAGAMARGRSLARLLRRTVGPAASAARQAERHPRHGGGAGSGAGVWP